MDNLLLEALIKGSGVSTFCFHDVTVIELFCSMVGILKFCRAQEPCTVELPKEAFSSVEMVVFEDD
jgi:hypothetical protein